MGAEARLPYLLTAVAGGFAMTLVRNETQQHSAALKSAGQNPISLLPLNSRGGLGRDVIAHAVGARHFGHNAPADARQQLVR